MSHVEQIKSRLSISSIISKRVALKLRAAGEFIGVCPFHSERTPSFTVSDNKGFYHCFGCGAHGDIFTFLIELEGYDYKTALKMLADLAGVSLPTYNYAAEASDKVLYKILERITVLYQKNLFSQDGKAALEYIRSRGIKEEIIVQYRLGFAFTKKNQLVDILRKDFDINDIKKTAIFSKKDADVLIDPMRGRLIFPISDKTNRIIAFGGRVLDESKPKYLNSAENPFFEKGKVLYGFNIAQGAIHKQRSAVIVEGYMDVLAMANAGITNVIAPLGTALKVSHIESLWDIVDNPVICMDADEAGKRAALKIALDILPHIKVGKNVKYIKLAAGKDPDEVIKNRGVVFMKELIVGASSLSSMLFQTYLDKIGYKDPESKALLKNELENLAGKIQDPKLMREYNNFFKNQVFALNPKKYHKQEIPSLKEKIHADSHLLTIFYLLLRDHFLLDDSDIHEKIIMLELKDQGIDKLRNAILSKVEIGADLQSVVKRVNNIGKIVDMQLKMLEPKQILVRALELYSLYIMRQQIEHTKKDLISGEDGASLVRLMALKNCESELKKKLNII